MHPSMPTGDAGENTTRIAVIQTQTGRGTQRQMGEEREGVKRVGMGMMAGILGELAYLIGLCLFWFQKNHYSNLSMFLAFFLDLILELLATRIIKGIEN